MQRNLRSEVLLEIKNIPFFKVHSKNRIFYFSVHDSEKKNSRVLVHIDPELKRVREKIIEFDFSWIELQGRSVKGSTLTSHKVDRVVNAPKVDEEDSLSEENPVKDINPEAGLSDQVKLIPKKEISPVSESKTAEEKVKPKDDQGLKDQVTFDFQEN